MYRQDPRTDIPPSTASNIPDRIFKIKSPSLTTAITVNISHPEQKYIDVSYRFSGIKTPELVLAFPSWSPGSYLIREYQSQVEAFAAKTPDGKKVAHQKIDKNHWLLNTKNKQTVIVTYRVYANELNVRGVFSDDSLVFINPTACFFYPKGHLNKSVTLKFTKSKSWHLSLSKHLRNKSYNFADFDELFDTPILAAQNLKQHHFKIGSCKYTVAIWGKHCGDEKNIIRDLQKIIRKEVKVFKHNPCKEYLFQILFINGLFGGLEHCFSSTNIFDGSRLRNKKDYQRFLSLLAHEHFHLWNVKRIRPQEIGPPFDYTQELYTRDLWIAEGITSYYDDHFIYRAGLYDAEQYMSLLSDNITRLENTKSVHVNSLSDSSFDTWIRFYRQNENSFNTTVSYYLKGGLVSMLLDWHIIKETKAKHTLDDVMLKLYKMYQKRPELGISRKEFFECVESFTGANTKSYMKPYIDGMKSIPWQKELSPFGIQLEKRQKSKDNYLGVILGQKDDKVFVKNIAEDSPAHHSDLQPKDEIIAFNNERFLDAKYLDALLTESSLDVLYCRHGRIRQTRIKLTKNPTQDYRLKLKKRLTVTQRKYLEAFLRR
jgi:predicted metalloprotease with PDZ domain